MTFIVVNVFVKLFLAEVYFSFLKSPMCTWNMTNPLFCSKLVKCPFAHGSHFQPLPSAGTRRPIIILLQHNKQCIFLRS